MTPEDLVRANIKPHSIVSIDLSSVTSIPSPDSTTLATLNIELWPEKEEDGHGWFKKTSALSQGGLDQLIPVLYLPPVVMDQHHLTDGLKVDIKVLQDFKTWRKVELVLESLEELPQVVPSSNYILYHRPL
jgi:hypothetical protein